MGQPVVHWELWSKDPQKVSEFYTKAFGWSVKHLPEMNYWLADTGGQGGINGGFMTPKEGPWPGNICLYIDVSSLGPAVEQVKRAGGKIVVEQMEVPGVGRFALFEDPDARVMGIWEQQRQTPAPSRRGRARTRGGSGRPRRPKGRRPRRR